MTWKFKETTVEISTVVALQIILKMDMEISKGAGAFVSVINNI